MPVRMGFSAGGESRDAGGMSKRTERSEPCSGEGGTVKANRGFAGGSAVRK